MGEDLPFFEHPLFYSKKIVVTFQRKTSLMEFFKIIDTFSQPHYTNIAKVPSTF